MRSVINPLYLMHDVALIWWPDEASGWREAPGAHPDEDRHKALSPYHIRPLSLQDVRGPQVVLYFQSLVVKPHNRRWTRYACPPGRTARTGYPDLLFKSIIKCNGYTDYLPRHRKVHQPGKGIGNGYKHSVITRHNHFAARPDGQVHNCPRY